jgi:predicted transcriptional regulator
MSDIADLTDMSAKAFREALNKLAASGFIKVTGEPLSEVIELTEKGRDAATLLS